MDFVSGSGTSAVELARPVAIAATAGGLDDQDAVVRVRQSGASDSLSLVFYRVDTLDGIIGGVRPGEAAYEGLVGGGLIRFPAAAPSSMVPASAAMPRPCFRMWTMATSSP